MVSVIMPLVPQPGPLLNLTQVVCTAVSEISKQRVPDEMEVIFTSSNPLHRELPCVRLAVRVNPRLFRHVQHTGASGWFELLNTAWGAARGQYITLARVEDRLAHPTVRLKARYMTSKTTCQLLSTAVYPTEVPARSFGEARIIGVARHDKSVRETPVRPHNLFTWAEARRRGFSPTRSSITGPNNFVREAPMWESDLRSSVGMFNTSLGDLADWELFLRATTRGKMLCHLSVALQTYYTPPAQHSLDLSHAHSADAIPALDQADVEHRQSRVEMVVRMHARYVALRVLIINEVPLSGVEGSHVRMGQVVQEMVDAGHHVTYVSRDTAWSWEMAKWVESGRASGIHVIVGDADLKSLHSLGNFDMVICAAWYWRCGAPSIPDLAMARLGVAHSKRIVVLSDDIHWVRAEQQQLVDSSCELYMGAVKDRELRDYSRADMIVAVTEEDAQYMRPYLKNKAHEYECVRHIPIIAKPVPALKGLEDSYRRRTTFLYVGSHHFGNRKAVRWLVNEVFPIVRRSIPEAQLHLVGADIWKEYAEGHEGVVPHGVIPELQPHMQAAKVMLVPNLVGGSGISTKTLLALESGLPFVTTPIGVTGVNADRTPEAFHIANDAREFARIATALFTDHQLWRDQAEAMRKHVLSHLSRGKLAAKVQETVYTISSDKCISARWQNMENLQNLRKAAQLKRYQVQQQERAKENAHM